MEISEYAKTILLSADLADKLVTPDGFTDRAPGIGISKLPAFPGRPKSLSLDDTRSTHFPKNYETAEARGLALHFFANHELLAMELMALMLLRFPDAPPEFRKGIAHTMTEEQTHLGLYQDRMQALGVGLGDVAVNGFFWRTMRDAASPYEFVAQMALTFEQANLDFCVHYRRLFLQCEDVESGDLLQKVYEDEIRHVKHGLHWFDVWRPKDRSQWQAYVESLPEPMTPARAKGPVMDIRGRRQAGLQDDFVRRLRVFSASKGRRPRLFLFEPFVEDVLSGAGPAKASKIALEYTRDLAPLVGLLGSADDRVVLETPPRLEHLEQLDDAGFIYPQSQTWAEVLKQSAGQRAGDQPASLHPWGFTPKLVQAAKQVCDQAVDLAPAHKYASKFEGRKLLQTYLDENPDCGPAGVLIGRLATTEAEVLDYFEAAEGPVVIKAPFSASGRHRIRLLPGLAPTDNELGFVRRALNAHGAVWVAPWLKRLRDLSMTFNVSPAGRVKQDPPLWLMNSPQGAFLGHIFAPITAGLSNEHRRQINVPTSLRARLKDVAEFVGQRLGADGYEGPAGVDMMIFETREGEARLHPLLEINARTTMGHIAQVLRRKITGKTEGLVRHVGLKEVRAAGFDSLSRWAQTVQTAAPVVLAKHGIDSGAVFLNDPTVAQRVVAVLSVGPTLADAQASLLVPDLVDIRGA